MPDDRAFDILCGIVKGVQKDIAQLRTDVARDVVQLRKDMSEMRERAAIERVKLAALTGGIVTIGNIIAAIVLNMLFGMFTGH